MRSRQGDRWSVYLVRRIDHALYTGIALDVERRFAAHCAGRGAKALRGRGPLELVAQRVVGERSLALRVEHEIKALTKSDKEALVASERRLAAFVSRLVRALRDA
ncbi:MAG: GIY-YIG nuclease family protein [Planctomycetota bacterium]